MIKIGQHNTLRVIKEVPFGLYLEAAEYREILLPKKYVPEGTTLHDLLDVFVYFDSEDKIIATTQKPLAELGQCAFLQVVDVNRYGAFLNWGLDKDLLVPKPEQHRPLMKDKSYLVYLKLDEQGRIIASSKLDHFLNRFAPHFKPGDEVELLVAERTPLGTKVIVNGAYWGLIHESDLFQTIKYGQKTSGFIKTVREDDKIDVVLRKPGVDPLSELGQSILTLLQQKGGFVPLHDKSSPQAIARAFNTSKKSFKSAIGQLYKQGKITIEEGGIRIANPKNTR
ncbi:MAG: S1-like domain-containing RNA-binding protein [Tatlockia sp.]|jgi:hypothetical protein